MTPPVERTVRVALGASASPVGQLTYARLGSRESSAFVYDASWLQNGARFAISPDLVLTAERQFRKAPTRSDSVFHFAIADTEPNGWGCRVIARDHAKRRKLAPEKGEAVSGALTEMDYLLGVDDESRVGAIRLTNDQGVFLRTMEDGGRRAPPLPELAQLIGASRAVEYGTETEADLRYLRGRGTSLGGMRPKCTIIDDDGHLAIGKFPSVQDERAVTRAEVLALRLAQMAGITAAHARIVHSDNVPIALIRRFDRHNGGRIPYLSAASLLQASREEDHSYTEIAERILVVSDDPSRDLIELWRRIIFSMLITNVDDHLQNHGFLHVGHGQWRLAPAFDINPMPDTDRELKTWLTEESGPSGSIEEALAAAGHFHLTRGAALDVLDTVYQAVRGWREMALSKEVGMTAREAAEFEPAFEHTELAAARRLLEREH
jgi:serine/threonine-protein kinase HipA